jgi:RNA 3'-terminal phosphate cyclase (ATP)
VLLPMLARMGVEADLTVQKYGYYPKGMGEATLTVKPNRTLKPLILEKFGRIKNISGISVCTFLADRQVADRQARTAREYLSKNGHNADIQVIDDQSNPFQKGSSIVLWAETDTGIIIGADAIGQLRVTAEAVGTEAAEKLVNELSAQPTTDVFLADILIPYIALAQGKSALLARTITEHIESNIWLMEKMLNIKFTIQKVNNLYKIKKTS